MKNENVQEMPMEDWLRGCVYHDGRSGYVTLPCDRILEIANYIQMTRTGLTEGFIGLRGDDTDEADTVEVVRCKNCKHAYKRKPINKTAVLCELFVAGMKDNDFCSHGERSEEENEAIDMAIEALERERTDEWCTDCKEYDTEKKCCPRFNRVIRGATKRIPHDDGTLEIKVEDATKVGRVLISDDKHRGGLYYPDEYEPQSVSFENDTKIKSCSKDSDLISRAEAIEALGEEPPVWCDEEYEIAERNQWRADIEAIESVPTAEAVSQSEQYKKGFEDAKRAFLVEYARESENMQKRNAQLEVRLNAQKAISADRPRWTPCAERMPDDGKWAIWCSNEGAIGIARFKEDCYNHFYPNGTSFGLEDAVAWMPLPEPYKESDTE